MTISTLLKTRQAFLGLLFLFAGLGVRAAHAAAVLYPAPAGAVLSSDFTVKVNGQSVSVYRVMVQNQPYSFAYFDFSGTVNIDVGIASSFMKTPIIRPISKGISYSLSGKTMSFSLSSPSQLSIEPDSNGIIDATPLLLFANPLEINAPNPGAPGVIYYGPGYYNVGEINLGSNSTLYIAGGAVVKGNVYASGDNIHIAGRGILDGGGVYGPVGVKQAIMIRNASNVSVDGIIVKDSTVWTIWTRNSSQISLNNIKMISSVGPIQHDGLDINSVYDYSIQDSFILSDDDSFQIGGINIAERAQDRVSATRMTLWTTGANNWRIGWRAETAGISNMTFTDIDVLHRNNYNWMVSIQVAGNGTSPTLVSNARFENIRVEADYGWTGSFVEVQPQIWGDGAQAPEGKVENIYFKDISISGYRNPSTAGDIVVSGASPISYVKGVTFENIVRYGQVTSASSANVFVGNNTSNIVFLGGGAPLPPDTASPTVPAGLSAQAVSSSQINLAWTASSDNVGVTGYKIFRSGTQIATTAGTSYSNTGLTASTAYSYTVAAYDAAGNTSGQSASASATTQAAPPPGFPVDLQGAALPESGSVVISVSKPANVVDATITLAAFDADNADEGGFTINGTCSTPLFGAQGVGPDSQVISVAYTVPASCFSNGSNTLLFTHTNTMGYRIDSAQVVFSGSAVDTQAPSVPAGLGAQAASSSQINLTWTASSDNVGVTGYKIFRGGAQIATAAGTSYSDTGLTASTAYSYTVAAYDAAGNASAQSSAASAATLGGASVSNLGVSANGKFTFGGVETFLLGMSYFDVLNYRTSDIDYLAAHGFNAVRIFTDWANDDGTPGDRSVCNADGSLNASKAATVNAFINYAQSKGMAVDVVILNASSAVWMTTPGARMACVTSTINAFKSQPRVMFDVVQEFDYSFGGLTPATVKPYTDQAKAACPACIIFASCGAPLSHPADSTADIVPSVINALAAANAESVIAIHDYRSTNWWSITQARVAAYRSYLASIGKTNVPVIFDEPNRLGWDANNYTEAQFNAAAAGAKAAGAAMWVFHTAANFELGASSLQAQLSATEAAVTLSMAGALAPSSLTCPGPGNGAFSACYFNNMTLDAAGLALARSEAAVNFDWGTGSPDPSVNADNFSARWQGNFAFNAGDYTFTMTVDDGGRLYVDGVLAIDTWINQAATAYTATRAMSAGTHLIKMEYYENGGGATAKLSWSQAGAPPVSTDLNGDGVTNVTDVQLGVNQALGISACTTGDVNKDGACNVTDVQKTVNAALGL